MRIVNIEIKDMGTVSKKKPSSTAGLASGYQITNITTSGVSVAETTGGWMMVELVRLPWNASLFDEFKVGLQTDFMELGHNELAQGYQKLAAENKIMAEEFLSVGLDTWPAWEA